MAPRQRGVYALSVVAALVLAGVLCWKFVFPPLPPPAEADRTALLRWLLSDLAREPLGIHVALVDRWQQELLSGSLEQAPVEVWAPYISASQRQRLEENALLLRDVWFHRRVDQYAVLPATDRGPFLDEQINVLFRWLSLEARLLAHDSSGEASTGDSSHAFFEQVDRWMAEAHGESHERMVVAVRDATLRWLATRSLVGQSAETIRNLAVHIAHDLEAGPMGEPSVAISPVEREQLAANGEILLAAWFQDQAAEFERLPPQERDRFLNHLIDLVQTSGVLNQLTTSAAAPRAGLLSQAAAAMRWLRLAEKRIADAPEIERPRMREFLAAIQAHLVGRQLRQTLRLPFLKRSTNPEPANAPR